MSYRVQYYQNDATITLCILGTNMENSTAEALDASTIRVRAPEESFTISLYAPIQVQKTVFTANSKRLEVRLTKERAESWPGYEAGSAKPTTNIHRYPSSAPESKRFQDTMDDEPEPQSSDPRAFFAKIYENATPEQRRAMEKSMRESGGTVLSTNWAEVGDHYVEPRPPE